MHTENLKFNQFENRNYVIFIFIFSVASTRISEFLAHGSLLIYMNWMN